jgi:ribosomal protein S18 acetylase RimI-like enzyme
MTAAEFDSWRAESLESFAEDLARAMDRPLVAARMRAAAQYEELLPDGLDTPGSHLLVVETEAGERVGIVWLGPHPTRADRGFIYDVTIEQTARGRGYGRAAMLAAEALLREEGKAAVDLNVFGFNTIARHLYESMGYEVVATQMTKKLS